MTQDSKMISSFSVKTRMRAEMIDITGQVSGAVRDSGISDGMCLVAVPHTTAGITINENADPSVCRDMLREMERLVPRSGHYEHLEGNADAHVKSSLLGHSVLVPVDRGRLVLGTWQGIFFCEFDGPRTRRVTLQCMGI